MPTLTPITISAPGASLAPPVPPIAALGNRCMHPPFTNTTTHQPNPSPPSDLSDASDPSALSHLTTPSTSPHPTTTPPQSPPSPTSPTSTTSIEDQLLEALIAPAGNHAPSPAHLARRFNIALTRVLDFLAAPSTRSRIAAAVAASDLALHQRSQSARLRAIDTLEQLLDTAETPVEQRRAAAALLRGPSKSTTTNAFSFTTKSAGIDDDEIISPRPIRPPPPRPHIDLTPEEVVTTLVDRLLDNDNPQPNSGLLTRHNFTLLHPSARRDEHRESYLDNPGRDALLLGATSAILHIPDEQSADPLPANHPDLYTRPEDRYSQTITFRYPDSTTHDATFHIRRITNSNPYEITLWLLSRIEHHFEEDSEDDSEDIAPNNNTS